MVSTSTADYLRIHFNDIKCLILNFGLLGLLQVQHLNNMAVVKWSAFLPYTLTTLVWILLKSTLAVVKWSAFLPYTLTILVRILLKSTLAVVKWSAFLPYTLTILVRILLKCTLFIVYKWRHMRERFHKHCPTQKLYTLVPYFVT